MLDCMKNICWNIQICLNFKRFDTSWYDDVIHETYLTNKEVVDEFISDALSNYLFDYSIKDVSSYQAINKVKDDNITLQLLVVYRL